MEILQPFSNWLQADWTHTAMAVVIVVAAVWAIARIRHMLRVRKFHAIFGFVPNALEVGPQQKKVEQTMDGLHSTVTEKEGAVDEAQRALQIAREELGLAENEESRAARMARSFGFQVG